MPTFVYVTDPTTGAAYEEDALLYEIANQYAIGSIADDGGNLQVELGTTGTSEAVAAGVVYLSILDGLDNTETSVVSVLSSTSTEITVDFTYSGSIPSSGNARIVEARDFTIKTGYTGIAAQPFKSASINMRPDLNGLYRINAKRSAVSRFDFTSDPNDNTVYSHNTTVSVYPDSVGSKTAITAYKHVTGTTPAATIAYTGCRQLVSQIVSNKYVIGLESTAEIDAAVDTTVDILGYTGKTYTVDFETNIADADTTITPSSGDFFTLVTEDSGQTITGVIFNTTEADRVSLEFAFDDGGGTPISYVFEFTSILALSNKTCCGGEMFLYWHPNGGWVYYEFNRIAITNNSGGLPTFTQNSNVVRSVAYSRQQDVLSLIADVEGETVFDYLNQIFFTMQVYSVTGTTYTRYNITSAQKARKRTRPFIATSNRFGITLEKAEILTRINEGK